MIDLYLNTKDRREQSEALKNYILFGLLFGWVLIVACIIGFFSVRGALEILFVTGVLFGILLVCSAVLVPALLRIPYTVVSTITEKIGNILFKVVLSVVYIVIIAPVGMLVKKKRKQYRLYRWDEEYLGEDSCFVASDAQGDKKPKSTTSFPKMMSAYRLFGLIVKNKWSVLIPVTTLLILLGLILFFASTNVVSFFIYTMF